MNLVRMRLEISQDFIMFLDGMAGELSEAETKLNNVTHQLETAKMEVQKPFPEEAELKGRWSS